MHECRTSRIALCCSHLLFCCTHSAVGLVISKRLIEAFGGEIKVTSTLGRGSQFSFTIICEGGRPSQTLTPFVQQRSLQPNGGSNASARGESVPTVASITVRGESAHIPTIGDLPAAGEFSPTQPMRRQLSDRSPPMVQLTQAPSPIGGMRRRMGTESSPGSGKTSRTTTPAHLVRSISSSQNSDFRETTTIDIHGVSVEDRQRLQGMKVWFIGEREKSDAWIKLLQMYGTWVRTFETIEEAKVEIPPPAEKSSAHPPLHTGSGNWTSAIAAAANPPRSVASLSLSKVCDVLFADMDSRGLTEEHILDMMQMYEPFRFFSVYSKSHLAPIPVSPLRPSGSPKAPPSTAARDPPPLTGGQGPIVGKGVMQLPSQLSTTASDSMGSPNMLSSPSSNGTFSYPHHSGGSDHLHPMNLIPTLPLSDHADHTGTATPEQHEEEDDLPFFTLPFLASPHFVVRRSLRKPFKLKQFMHAILSIASESLSEVANSSMSSRQSTAASMKSPLSPSSSSSSSSLPPQPPSARMNSQSSSSKPKLTNIAKFYPLRVLLAEDNLINQVKRIGCFGRSRCEARVFALSSHLPLFLLFLVPQKMMVMIMRKRQFLRRRSHRHSLV
jgi:hypothetical protein